ncbi:hypothetical protein N7540_000592 [Penicillium herquei]|nr:hypothetical protein N7540_000592 [Penicillium herquei]
MSSLEMSSSTTPVTSRTMGKKILLLYRRESGAFVWKNKPGLRLTEDNRMINNIENETRIGELLSTISKNMASEQSLQNYSSKIVFSSLTSSSEFVCSWQSLALPRYHCVLVSQIEGPPSILPAIQLPSPVSSTEETSTGTEVTPATQSDSITSALNNTRPLLRSGNQNANENTTRNETRPGLVARELDASPTNHPRRPRYFDHHAWRIAANEYEAEAPSPIWH